MTAISDIIRMKTANLQLSADEINLAVEEVSIAFKNYCNRSDIPSDARFLIANLAADLLRSQHSGDDGSELPEGEIGSISVDDVSLSFDASRKSHVVNVDSFLMNYGAQLNKFRKMRW